MPRSEHGLEGGVGVRLGAVLLLDQRNHGVILNRRDSGQVTIAFYLLTEGSIPPDWQANRAMC
jgi:hypothetical protein